jgi:hypothetical protein
MYSPEIITPHLVYTDALEVGAYDEGYFYPTWMVAYAK